MVIDYVIVAFVHTYAVGTLPKGSLDILDIRNAINQGCHGPVRASSLDSVEVNLVELSVTGSRVRKQSHTALRTVRTFAFDGTVEASSSRSCTRRLL